MGSLAAGVAGFHGGRRVAGERVAGRTGSERIGRGRPRVYPPVCLGPLRFFEGSPSVRRNEPEVAAAGHGPAGGEVPQRLAPGLHPVVHGLP
jgi:hypothetical protein